MTALRRLFPLLVAVVAIGCLLLVALGGRSDGRAMRLLDASSRLRDALVAVDSARVAGDALRIDLAEREVDVALGEVEAVANEVGGAALDHSAVAGRAVAAARLGDRDARLAARGAADALSREARRAADAAATQTSSRAIAAVLVAIGLAIAIAVAIALSSGRRDDGTGARVEQLEREQRTLVRRLRLVDTAASERPIELLARNVVAAVAEEAGAGVVLLHVPPAGEPLAPEVLAAIGVSTVGSQSPRAVREVLNTGIAVTLPLDDVEDAARLEVRTSVGNTRPREVLLRPLKCDGRTLAVVEIGVSRPLDARTLEGLDALLAVGAQSLAHALATEYARRLSSEVRAQAETVAGVETELDAVFEAVADGLAVTNSDGEIVRINAAGRLILGVASLDDPESRKSLADRSNPLLQALKEGTPADGLEVALRTDDGVRRIVQVKISPLSSATDARAAVAMFRDVTRERQLEHNLRKQSRELAKHVDELEKKQQELERATRLKSEFLANMSHELRTPLNAIIGFTEVLLDGTYGPLQAKQKDCARDVLAGGRHLLGLINDILDLSKIEAGKMELQREDLDLADVVHQAVVFVTPQVKAKNLSLAVEVPTESFLVHGDPDRVRQILVNLLSNAVKFTPDGGDVAVRAEREEDGSVRVSVDDTGIGIAPEHADKLFRDFSQVDGSHTRRFGGTGLGLAICKRLIEMQGGTISYRSTPGSGSTFFFTLPRAIARPAFTAPPASHASRTPSSALQAASPRHHVLVIDADDAAGRLAEAALREAALAPTVTTTWSLAVRALREVAFDAVVIDPQLPDVPPDEALRVLREEARVGVVVTSTLGSDELPASLRVGITHAGKPIDRATLVQKVEDAIARKGAPRRALVVDPGPVDGAAVRALLEREAFVVDVAGSAGEARTALDADRFDLIIAELDLPDEDGARFVQELGDRAPGKVIVLTAREIETPPDGAALFVVKGTLSRSAFVAKIAEVLVEKRRRRVLAVDDNDQNLRLMTAVLTRRGIDVVEARDAATAIALARKERPDAILMDVMLPDVDGLVATRELKRDPFTLHIPVIAVTANAMPGDAEKAREAGCCDYVTKPIDARTLLRAIDGALA